MNRVMAVKTVRDVCKVGLVEAKTAVDKIVESGYLADTMDDKDLKARYETELRAYFDSERALSIRLAALQEALDKANDSNFRAERRLDTLMDVLGKMMNERLS